MEEYTYPFSVAGIAAQAADAAYGRLMARESTRLQDAAVQKGRDAASTAEEEEFKRWNSGRPAVPLS